MIDFALAARLMADNLEAATVATLGETGGGARGRAGDLRGASAPPCHEEDPDGGAGAAPPVGEGDALESVALPSFFSAPCAAALPGDLDASERREFLRKTYRLLLPGHSGGQGQQHGKDNR